MLNVNNFAQQHFIRIESCMSNLIVTHVYALNSSNNRRLVEKKARKNQQRQIFHTT